GGGVMAAKTSPTNPATVIRGDPGFPRTSAMANIYAPVRAGSDIVFLGALIRYVLDKHAQMLARVENGKKDRKGWSARDAFFFDYLTRYTNAPTLICAEYKDTEDPGMDGVFSGLLGREPGLTAPAKSGRCRSGGTAPHADARGGGARGGGDPPGKSARVGRLVGPRPVQDPTMTNPRCVFQVLRKHFDRYTPE